MIERIPAQIIYECDRCLVRERCSEDDMFIRDDHPLHRWLHVTIMPAIDGATCDRVRMARHVYLCRRCVRDLGTPFTDAEDEAPPLGKSSGA